MNRQQVLDMRRYFSNIGIWPPAPAVVRPETWLANFLPHEQDHAIALLDAFLYFNEEMTDKLFRYAFQSIAVTTSPIGASYEVARTGWADFLDGAIVTHPTGERPKPLDSGQLFTRKARDVLGLAENGIDEPVIAMRRSLTDRRAPIVFVDDFSGSGDQFMETWLRRYPLALPGSGTRTFADIAAGDPDRPIVFCVAACTHLALERIAAEAPRVTISTAHVLPETASLASPESEYIPDVLRPTMATVIRDASRRSGIADATIGEYGYKDLGLGIAFAHSIPDASLPAFWRRTPGWQPLLGRSL